MKKAIIISVIFSFLLSSCGNSISKEEIHIEKLTWTEDYFWTDSDKLGLIIENSSSASVDIKIQAQCYDIDGNYLDERLYSINSIAPNSQYFTKFVLENDIADITFDYECSASKYDAINPEKMITHFYVIGGKGYISVKNTSTTDLDMCECTIVFFDNSDNIIQVESIEINDGDVPAGETCQEEVSFPLNRASEKIYINAYAK